jgi:hypothetical protein
MKVIITESQYKKILSEQSNVYDDDISYQKALKIYNQIWKTYNDSVKYYNFIKNLGDINVLNAEDATENGLASLFNNTTKKTTANSLRKKEEIYKQNGLQVELKYGKRWIAEEGQGIDNNFKHQKLITVSPNESYKDLKNKLLNAVRRPVFFYVEDFIMAPLFKKPTMLKPILGEKKPEVSTKVTPVTKPVVSPTVQSTLDKTKPVDFYFGNRILRAPDYEIAKKFAEKLAIRNLNSNQVFVYKDKNNERWFIGANDKIYFSQYLYNQDPNDAYVDPVKMGMIFI